MPTPLPMLLNATFRANPRYEIVRLEQLPPGQQELLRDLRDRPGFAGVLCPREPNAGTLKAVSPQAARLYTALAQPGRLPPDVRASLGDDGAADIAALVLDGLLEIACDGEGNFVSGAGAYGLLYGQILSTAAQSTTARLSQAALRYAQALELADPAQLSARLYLYNHQPADARWRRSLPTREAVAAYLGVQPGGAAARLLEAFWRPVPATPESEGWLAWHMPARALDVRDDAVTYKLYISAPCEVMPEVFAAALQVLAEHRTAYLKVGSDLHGLLRPDKMVAYFDSFEELRATGDALAQTLDGAPAQGVPFTASFDDAGLLCWGIDPPRRAQLLRWHLRESWRLWVTNRLATYLLVAREAAGVLEPWQFALERIRLYGVDIDTWTPQASIWESDVDEE